MHQGWFEMTDVKKRFLDKSVWIPLRQSSVLIDEEKYGYLGFREEYFGIGSIAVPLVQRNEAEKLGWMEIGLKDSNLGYFDGEEYKPAHIYKNYEGTLIAEHLVILSEGNSIECSQWYLNNDLVVTLGLKQEGDIWRAISYGYEDVIKIERNENNFISGIFIKASYLKDYLSARRMALYLTSYRSRKQTVEDSSYIKWISDTNVEEKGLDKWKGRIIDIHEGGNPLGGKFAVFNVSRTDIDYEEDVPKLDFPEDCNTKSESFEGEFMGKKLQIIEGELWRNEWVEPSEKSTIVCNEEVEPTSFFITDSSGKLESRKTLENGSRWLWFNPAVINAILTIRGSSLKWYTKDTGDISCSPNNGVHFGINSIGLINVYAEDIGSLPDWQQKIWAGYNVSPDGKVSPELLLSQMEAKPASTQSPEEFLLKGIEYLNQCLLVKYKIQVFKDHPEIDNILKKTHRFISLDQNGLFELAKNIIKLTSERIEASQIKKIVKPDKNDKWGALKSLEKLLALNINEDIAHELITPFWGVYTLRGADAHLPSKEDLQEAYDVCGIDSTKPFIIQGYQMLNQVVSCLYRICEEIEK